MENVPVKSNSVKVNGISMRWEEQGEGPPVVLIHGLPTGPSLWHRVMPMVQGARTLAWEMVGYGDSIAEGRGRDISVARQAGYLEAWMDEIGLEKALLVGHDLGGGVAQIAALRHPDRGTGLVLTNAICYDSWPVPSVKSMRALGPVVEQLPDAAFKYVFANFLRRGHDKQARAEQAIQAHWAPYERAPGKAAAAFVRQIRALDVKDTLTIANQLPQLALPVRLVWGAADSFQKIGYGYRLAYDLDAPLDRIEHGKHFVPEDHPERVAAAINDLIGQDLQEA